MQSTPCVFRIEAEGEAGVPYPTLNDAMREPPSHEESTIATSDGGVVLAESQVEPISRAWLCLKYYWRPTVAGTDVLNGVPFGLARAS